jgi:peptide/nickel transport system substrate-binding protein
MLVDAGYPNGFSVTLHRPNDRYVNDEAVCQAVEGGSLLRLESGCR